MNRVRDDSRLSRSIVARRGSDEVSEALHEHPHPLGGFRSLCDALVGGMGRLDDVSENLKEHPDRLERIADVV